MTGKTTHSCAQKPAQNKACRKGRLYVYSSYSAFSGRKRRESTPRLAAALNGNGKTIRATDPRQRMIALTNAKGSSHG